MSSKPKIAVLDDYQQVALKMADWSAVQELAEVTIFHNHVNDEEALIERLRTFNAVCLMRERTPLSHNIISALPNLQLVVTTGKRNPAVDDEALNARGIKMMFTGGAPNGAPELTWALLMAIARHIPKEVANVRSNRWQQTIGVDLKGKTIGIIGLGTIGSKVAAYAKAFDMKVIVWSQNLTEDKAQAAGATLVSKETLFREADFVSIHLILSERSKGTITSGDLALMKPTAYFINTSRGPLVEERALIELLQQKKIAGAALDVYDTEPLPADHPFRTLDNILPTPHIGYVTENTYRIFYGDTVKNLLEWLNTQ